mgnify:CR=1 FL=1
MIYSKHYLKINGKRKTFGMIGETHIYSKKESKFVKDIMRNYEIIGLEGDGLPLTFLEKIMGMSWRYPFKIISNVSNRSFDYKNLPCTSITIVGKKLNSSCQMTIDATGPVAVFDVTPIITSVPYYIYSVSTYGIPKEKIPEEK